MAEFKCISCGELKENEEVCTCPNCGYTMFETPYDRRSVLISEIENFIYSLELKTLAREDLIFEEKDKDDRRFPDFDKVLKYVSNKERTEDFLNNLMETVEQLRLHFTSQFTKLYNVSFETLNNRISQYDEIFISAIHLIMPNLEIKLEPIEWKPVSLLYTETQNKFLWFSANELLDLIKKLAQKIYKFIQKNNLYGSIHKFYPQKIRKCFVDEIDYKDELESSIVETEKIIDKIYVIDIIDDGSKEMKEMLSCLWHGIELIMISPLFIKSYNYVREDVEFSEQAFLKVIGCDIEKRYENINKILDLTDVLKNKTEKEIFDIYKDLIEIDKLGFLVPIGTKLTNIGESEKKLEKLVGLDGIKESIKKIKAYAVANRDNENLNIHMCFMGNPGSGKTEVARYIAGILYENKILPTNKMIEVDRSGLVSQYFGATAEKTSRVISSAMGGVLFIDEAYALGNNSDTGITDYGKEAIDTLVKAMEDYRGKFCVILAGYKNEMQQMLAMNPGFRSRIQFSMDFPNYSREELKSIAKLMINRRQYSIGNEAMSRILDITDIKRKNPNFANAREIRNILDQVIMCQNLRTVGTSDKELGVVDVNKYIKDEKINLPTLSKGIESKILSGDEELERLIGLGNVKRMIKKIKAYAKRNNGEEDFNLHMCFYGNPGTGKTEVARILSRILYDVGVLGEAKLIETDGRGLLGQYIGETAHKTDAKINEAMNGVLFIDEAYGLLGSALTNAGSVSYGEEAINVLLKEMEDKRGQFCTILAGYKDEMKNLLNSNPGFDSRIQFVIEFPDYTRDELEEIAIKFLEKKKYIIDASALALLLDITEYYRKCENFANARTVRNILDQVIMNQNLRTEDDENDAREIIKSDVEDYLVDEGIDLNEDLNKSHRIGFL